MNTEHAEPIDNHAMLLLQRQRAGDCMEDLSEKLREVATAVSLTGKKGSVTLTVTLEPIQKGSGRMVNVVDKITSNVPKRAQDVSIFFIAEDGSLSREDQRQRELDFDKPPRVVATPQTMTRAGDGKEMNFSDERPGEVAPPPPGLHATAG